MLHNPKHAEHSGKSAGAASAVGIDLKPTTWMMLQRFSSSQVAAVASVALLRVSSFFWVSMRDAIIVGLVLLLGLWALRHPWIGVLNWNWISIMNPHRYAWGFAVTAPVAMIAALTTLIGLMFTKDKQSPFKGAPVWWLAAFVVWMTLSWQMGYDPAEEYAQWDKVMKIFLMTFVALSLLSTRHQFMAFAWVCIGSMAALSVKGGFFTVISGGSARVWGPPGSFIADNNEFALAVIMAIPLIHFLQLQLREGWPRHLMSVAILLSFASALGSHSRGALLAMGAMALVFWLRTKRKGQIGLMLLVVGLLLLPMMPDHWWERMDSIQTYEEDASAMGRINAWIVAYNIAKDNFFGAGMSYAYPSFFFIYGEHETVVRAAHSVYFQVLGNHGFIGLFLYLMIFVSTYRSAGWLRKNAENIPQAQWAASFGSMAQVCLVCFAVGGAFLSMAYFDLPFCLVVMVVIARRWVERRSWETEPDISFLEYLGFKRKKPGLKV